MKCVATNLVTWVTLPGVVKDLGLLGQKVMGMECVLAGEFYLVLQSDRICRVIRPSVTCRLVYVRRMCVRELWLESISIKSTAPLHVLVPELNLQ